METDILQEIATSISELEDSKNVKRLISDALLSEIPFEKIVEKGVRKGLEEVGNRYDKGEYFLSELLYAGSLVNDAFTILKPHLKKKDGKGVIVLGTVRGDIHDIGKNIFKMLAEASGFEVHDLGVDVDPEVFVRKTKDKNAGAIGLSALLTTTLEEMRNVIEELKAAGVRNDVKVLLGGNAVTKEFGSEIGADYTAFDAVEGVEVCKRWFRR